MASKHDRRSEVCWVHGQHIPASRTFVWHHIIPREWQYRWDPSGKKVIDVDHDRVWATATVCVCPTGHANIHYWINKIQDEIIFYHNLKKQDIDVVLSNFNPKGAVRKELAVAKQAYLNWIQLGAPIELCLPPRYLVKGGF